MSVTKVRVFKIFLSLTVLLGLLYSALMPRRCVAEGTFVDTPFGPRPVAALRPGDSVWSLSPDGELAPGRVVSCTRGFSLRQLQVEFSAGSILVVTSSHPVATDDGWIEAGELRRGQEAVGRLGTAEITRIDRTISMTWVYDLTVEPHPNFFANDILVHNKRGDAREADTIGDMRTVVSAMQTYASLNCGLFAERLTDLTKFRGVPIPIPGYPDDAPDFLGPDLARPVPYAKSRYLRNYQGFGRSEDIPSTCVPGSVVEYCYTAHPIDRCRQRWARVLPPRLADMLGCDKYRSFAATGNGALYVDLEARDMTCVDGKPPDYAMFLE